MKLSCLFALLINATAAAAVATEELDHRDLGFSGVDELKRINIDFNDPGLYNGDPLDQFFYKKDNVVISVYNTGNNDRCITETPFIIDTTNPQEGCDAGEGDADLKCDSCGKALIISEKNKKGCKANDCAPGGTILFHFYNPVQVMFIDILDTDGKITYEIDYGDKSESGEVVLNKNDPSKDGQLERFFIGNSNVKQLKITSSNSFAISQLSFRAAPDGGVTHGDPHFKTWGGLKFDYHGQCDLVLAKAPHAVDGKGLDIHIRSQHIDFYSYIERAAVKIGREVVEFGHDGAILNGLKVEDFSDVSIAGLPMTYSDEPVEGRPQLTYKIFLSETEYVLVKVFKQFMAVRVMGASIDNFRHSSGILGDFYTGQMLGRDGVTLIRDTEQFSLEWQVNNDDGNLFQIVPEPQFPVQCKAPPPIEGRKLAHTITEEQASEACKFWGEDEDSCIFDVLATGDLDMAGAY